MKTVPYTFEEFERHIADFMTVREYEHIERDGEQVEVGKDGGFELSMLRLMDYMKQVYAKEEEAQHKCFTFILINSYIAKHTQEFTQADLMVAREKHGDMARRSLYRAVHHFYTDTASPKYAYGPTPEEVITLAKRYAEERE
jgi:hypothetical protein